MTNPELARGALQRLGVSPETLAAMSDRDVATLTSNVFGSLATFVGSVAGQLALAGVAPGHRAHVVDRTGVSALLRATADVLEDDPEEPVAAIVSSLAEAIVA